MTRLIVVSNRVPSPRMASAGGLATAMSSALRTHGGIWFGWSGRTTSGDVGPPTVTRDGAITYVTTDLSRSDYEAYYGGFANRTLWPLLHFRPDLVDYSEQNYSGYLRVNRQFAAGLLPLIREGDQVWVQDFHLIPLAGLLREQGVGVRLGLFLHTPLPPPDLLRVLPGHRALMDAMAEYDLVGFHTEQYRRSYEDYQRDLAGASLRPGGWLVTRDGRRSRSVTLPISIDPAVVSGAAVRGSRNPVVVRLRRELGDGRPDRQLVIGADRLDYSKGLVERFTAFGRFLALHPEWAGQVTLLQLASTSREEVPEYRRLRSELEQTAGAINGRYANPTWTPIRYVNRTYQQSTLFGFYRTARVAMVTPLRDGMNLVAKEYVAAQDPDDPGVLLLSTFAGAAEEMHEAIFVNPFDADGVANSLDRALSMGRSERRQRWSSLMAGLRRWDIHDWRDGFLRILSEDEPARGGLRGDTGAA